MASWPHIYPVALVRLIVLVLLVAPVIQGHEETVQKKRDRVSVADRAEFSRHSWSGCNNTGAPPFNASVDRSCFGDTVADWAWQRNRVHRWAKRRPAPQLPLIIFTFATTGYKDYIESWVVNLEVIGVSEYIVIAEDEELYDFLEEFVPGHAIHFGFRDMEHSNEHAVYGTNEFFRTTFSKPAHFKRLLLMDVDLFFVDGDVSFLKSPIPVLQSLSSNCKWNVQSAGAIPFIIGRAQEKGDDQGILSNWSQANTTSLYDMLRLWEEIGVAIAQAADGTYIGGVTCSGVAYVSASDTALQFMDRWWELNENSTPGCGCDGRDQPAFEVTFAEPEIRAELDGQACILPESHFVDGRGYGMLRRESPAAKFQAPEELVLIHWNHYKGDDKKKAIQDAGLWYTRKDLERYRTEQESASDLRK